MKWMKKFFNCVEIVEAGLHKNWRNETWEMLDEKGKNMNVPSSAKGKRRDSACTLEGKLRRKYLALRWTLQFSGRNLEFQSYRWKGGPTFLGGQKYKIFHPAVFPIFYGRRRYILLWHLKILKDKPGTESIMLICFYLPSTYTQHCKNINAQLIAEAKCVAWAKDPSTARFVCLNT